MINKTSIAVLVTLASTASWSVGHAEPDLSKLPPAAKQKGVTYAKDIEPIFKASCAGCHGEQRQKGGLRLDNLEAALKGGEDGKVIVPGKSDKSPLVISVARLDEKTAMPPEFKPGQRGPGGPGGPGGGRPGGPPPAGPGGGSGPGAGPGGPPPGPGGRGGFGPPPKPLTTDQVALIRAWIDQGAK